MKKFEEFTQSLTEARRTQRNYKLNQIGPYNTKATVCYISPVTRMRTCDDIWFRSKMDALGFKDNVKGFPKGAEVEAIKVMKESVNEASTNFRARKAFNDKISKAKKGQCDGIMKELKKAFDKGEINASDYDELTASCGRKMDQLGEETGTSAVAGAGDDSSTVVVKKKKRRTLDDVLKR